VSTIVVSITAILALLFAGFTRDIAIASSTKQRAQIAADAAALAAVEESGPWGSGDPVGAATRFARANGGRVVRCLCRTGATAMQVQVSVGDVLAEARAVFDPTKLMPAVSADAGGLNPRLAAVVARLIDAAHGGIRLVSGYRTYQEQEKLWEAALAKYGSAQTAREWVAPPGTSMHERGLAVDLGGDLNLALTLIARLRLPLWRPLSNEPWHFELVGSRG
jgi:hypothetical protein